MRRPLPLIALVLALPQLAGANPYFNPRLVPKDRARPRLTALAFTARSLTEAQGTPVLRLQVDWSAAGETYSLGAMGQERSGTATLPARVARRDGLGSYHGTLIDAASGAEIGHQALGTGQEYRKLVRTMAFRFPMPAGPVILRVEAENPETGVLETVLTTAALDPAAAPADEALPGLMVRQMKAATEAPALVVNVYAEGYKTNEESRFWEDAAKVPDALAEARLPHFANMEINAVYLPSQEHVGDAHDLSPGIHGKNTALGLYYPYWDQGGSFYRWYHVVYPTDQGKFRRALGQVAYDYPIALVNSGEYWGVGNYNELTAIPSRNDRFTYLLTHELGHFFGLNEEYEGGGGTELAFAPGIQEPWSQNLTFLRNPALLKWSSFVTPGTPLPTPDRAWRRSRRPLYGAYRGGYGDSDPQHSHKPGLSCIMDRHASFCPICGDAIGKKIRFDLGL